MGIKRAFAVFAAGLLLTGCVNSSVQEWALLGAASGAGIGAGVGVLVTDPDLLGSRATPETGDVSIDTGSGVLAGLLIGTVLGAIVGSMVGHHRYSPDEEAYEAQREANTGDDGQQVELTAEDLGMDLGDLEGLDEDDDEDLSGEGPDDDGLGDQDLEDEGTLDEDMDDDLDDDLEGPSDPDVDEESDLLGDDEGL